MTDDKTSISVGMTFDIRQSVDEALESIGEHHIISYLVERGCPLDKVSDWRNYAKFDTPVDHPSYGTRRVIFTVEVPNE